MEHAVTPFLFPNDIGHVVWTIMIVLYPYITGLVAGAFVVAASYEVFGKKEFKPVAKFALVASFSFALFATMPLLLHLHQPQRAFNIMFTPNFSSAMSGFGFIYSFYLTLLTLEILLVFRPYILHRARTDRGVMGIVYKALSLGVTHESARSRAIDHRAILILSIIGIPGACVLHGYVGFIFGAIKANPWWSSAMMPIVFLVSAIVSGVAMLIILYVLISRWRQVEADDECVRNMIKLLWLFLVVAFTLEELDLANKAYEQGQTWEVLSALLHGPLAFSSGVVQVLIGSVIPLLLLPIGIFKSVRPQTRQWVGVIGGLLVLVQVLSMRWNVVIGGQLFSKSFRGFTDFHLEVYGREGLLAAIIVFCMPFVVFTVVSKVLPIWQDNDAIAMERRRQAAADQKG